MRQTKKDMLSTCNRPVLSSMIVANNTLEISYADGTVAIRFHNTDVVVFHTDGSVTLDSGGWRTPATKDRINQYIPAPWTLSQENKIWFVSRSRAYDKHAQCPERFVFADGITIKGLTVTGAGPSAKSLQVLDKSILKYVSGFMKTLQAREINKPGPGDCWYCLFRDQNGRTWGDTVKNGNEHIREHIREMYFVPSLLLNAIVELPISTFAQGCLGYWLKYHDDDPGSMADIAMRQIRTSLRRYLRNKLGLAR